MKPITSFKELIARLKKENNPKRIVVICGYDSHTEYALSRAFDEGIATALLVGDQERLSKLSIVQKYSSKLSIEDVKGVDEAAKRGVELIRQGKGDVLMKGVINTDNLLRAILNKEFGLLPKGRILTHLSVVEMPTYHKLLFFTDAAVIPRPEEKHFMAEIAYAIENCYRFGIEEPRVALIHCTEKISEKFPHTINYQRILERSRKGEFGKALIDGPMDVRTACEKESGEIKGIKSVIGGEADVLVFPNIESGNCFYKAVSLFAKAEMAGTLQGTECPIVVTSRSDSGLSKYYSLALACLTAKGK